MSVERLFKAGLLAVFVVASLWVSGGALAADCGTTPSLLANWTGDTDGSDSSGNGYTLDAGSTGANAGSAVGVGGVGYAFSFDGQDDMFRNTSINIPNAGSMILWINPDDLTSSTVELGIAGTRGFTANRRLVVAAAGFGSPEGNYEVPVGAPETTSDDQLKANVGTNATQSLFGPSVLEVGKWTQLALVWDYTADEFTLWADGEMVGDAFAGSVAPPYSNSEFSIGGFINDFAADRFWDGLIDNARLYDCELSSSQIGDLYAGEFPDADSDGVPDKDDNCLDIANGASEAPNDQIDADGDGYGNACDPDYNDDGETTTLDYAAFLACFQNNTHVLDPNCEESDHNNDGDVTTIDYATFVSHFTESTTAVGTAPGPSGLACAGTAPCP